MALRLSDLSLRGAPVSAGQSALSWLRGPETRLWAIALRWYRPIIVGLAVGGVIMGVGTVMKAYGIGMWPPHDTSAFWLAGRHILESKPVYGGSAWFLAFVYTPPVAVVLAPLSLLDYQLFSLALIGMQIAALRYITGSWIIVGILGWLPWLQFEFVAGNVDILMAAAIYAALTERRYAGVAIALLAFAKFSPALVLVRAGRRQWLEFTVTAAFLLLISVPWLPLWPDWVARISDRGPDISMVPLLVRLPIAAALLAYRRPWAVAAGAALATPVFYEHSTVLLVPAIRLWWDARMASRAGDEVSTPQIAAADGRPAAGVISRGRTAEAPSS